LPYGIRCKYLNYVIYVDAGYGEKIGGHIAWYNETTGKRFYEKRNCADAFRCELEAVIRALEDHKELMENNEIHILLDNKAVADQLNSKSGINHDDVRSTAMQIWGIAGGKKVTFQWVPRDQNKAGKMLGS